MAVVPMTTASSCPEPVLLRDMYPVSTGTDAVPVSDPFTVGALKNVAVVEVIPVQAGIALLLPQTLRVRPFSAEHDPLKPLKLRTRPLGSPVIVSKLDVENDPVSVSTVPSLAHDVIAALPL